MEHIKEKYLKKKPTEEWNHLNKWWENNSEIETLSKGVLVCTESILI